MPLPQEIHRLMRALKDPVRLLREVNPGRQARRQIAARNARISALERELARRGVEPPETSTPVFFVIGHMRSGTTWLMQMLDAHPEILCKGEGRIFGADWKRKALKKEEIDRPASSLYAALLDADYLRIWVERSVWSRDGDPGEHLENLVRMAADYFLIQDLLKSGKRLVGDKSPLLNPEMVREISRIYPEARVIHIIRDGRDMAVSAAHHLWNFGNVKEGSEIAVKREAYRADPKKFAESGQSIFAKGQLEQLASDWSSRVGQAIQDGPALLGGNYREIQYEALLQRPEREFRTLLEFLGVSSDDESVGKCVNSTRFEKLAKGRKRGEEDAASFYRKGVAGDWKNIFTQRDKQVFKKEAGGLLIRLGYEADDDW